jgi:hypothetical protein
MPKPVCAKCDRFMRPHVNGTYVLEGKPRGGGLAPPGKEAPQDWLPYKLWIGDLWRCPTCEAEIVIGFSGGPLSQDFYPEFKDHIERAKRARRFVYCNDC